MLKVTPERIDFGELAIGQTRTSTVSIRNESTASLTIVGLDLLAADGTSFELAAVPELPVVVALNMPVTADLRFVPTTEGSATGTFSIVVDNVADPIVIPVSGEALPEAEGVPELSVIPLSLDFDNAELGSAQPANIVIENTGNAPVTVTTIAIITGADAGFALQDAFGGDLVLDPGDSTTVTVVYTPVAPGASEGLMRIESSADNVDVLLNGMSVVVPASIAVSPANLAYGMVPLGESRDMELTISNPSDGNLSVSDIRVSEGANVGFALREPFDSSVDIVPSGQFTVMIALTPVAAGELAGNLQITSNSVDGPLTDVPLSGVGMAQSIALIHVEPTDEVDFGNVVLGQTRMAPLTLSNNSDADLTIDRIAVSEGGDRGFTIEGGPIENVVLTPGAPPLEVALTLTPEVVGPLTGLLEVQSNAGNEPVVKRPLIGTGMAIPVPVVTVTPDQVNFDEVNVGDQVRDEVQIKNTGDADLTVTNVLIAQGAASGFGVTGAPEVPTVLAPGEVLTVTAGFAPAASGPVTGTLSVLSDASNGAEQLVPLQAMGKAVADTGTETTTSTDTGTETSTSSEYR
jgi:hypothetical protein